MASLNFAVPAHPNVSTVFIWLYPTHCARASSVNVFVIIGIVFQANDSIADIELRHFCHRLYQPPC